MLRLPFHATDALAGFFASAESDAGMRSTFGAFVALAQSGVRTDGGVRDPEVNVTDERLLRIGRGREVWRALRRLPGATQCVLYAAHGPTDWAKLVDASFGRGKATKAVALVGPYLGVALLTATVRDGFAASDPNEHADKPLERRALWNTTGGWLIAAVAAEGKRKEAPTCSAVSREARDLLTAAHAAYADAHNATLTRSGHRIELVHVAEAEAPPKPARASRAGAPKAPRERVARVTGAEVEAWA
jgi:hypothetical protein